MAQENLRQSFTEIEPVAAPAEPGRRAPGLRALAAAGGAPSWAGLDLHWVYSDLLSSIHRRTRCLQRAYDVLHDALLRYVLAGQRTGINQPHAYLRRVVGSVLADHYHDAERYAALLSGFESAAQHDGSSAAVPTPEQLADLRQRLQLVEKILNCLPSRCREIFWMFRIEGLPQSVIAEQMDISVNMVERHVMRAMLDLRAARDLLDR